jgi:hypothetical protein
MPAWGQEKLLSSKISLDTEREILVTVLSMSTVIPALISVLYEERPETRFTRAALCSGRLHRIASPVLSA